MSERRTKVITRSPHTAPLGTISPSDDGDMTLRGGGGLVLEEKVGARMKSGNRLLVEAVIEAIAPVIRDFVRDSIAQFRERADKLEARLAELETRGVEYRGIHQRACDYRRGALVTFDGSIWAAVRDVAAGETPGQSSGWQLAIKHGRDSR
jgi:hypothetical protein